MQKMVNGKLVTVSSSEETAMQAEWTNNQTIQDNIAYVDKRVTATDGYGTIGEQLDMIYKDLRDGTQLWQTRIGNVKNVLYPKPGAGVTTPPNVTPILTAKRNSPSAAFKEICIARTSANQAIANTTKNKVVFGTKLSDPNNVFVDNKYTSLTGGLYEVTAFAQVTNYALLSLVNNYTWSLFVTQAGSTSASYQMGSYTHGVLAATPGSMQGTYMVYLAANDTIQVDIQKSDATSLNVTFAYVNIKKISEA